MPPSLSHVFIAVNMILLRELAAGLSEGCRAGQVTCKKGTDAKGMENSISAK